MDYLTNRLTHHQLGLISLLAPSITSAQLQEVFNVEIRHEFFKIYRRISSVARAVFSIYQVVV